MGKNKKKFFVFPHPNHCANCRHAIQKIRPFPPGKYLCNAGGMVHYPALPLLWIYLFGCPLFE
jgi:hypothetical protein